MTLYLDLDGVFADFDVHIRSYGVHRNDQTFHHTPQSTWTKEQKDLFDRVGDVMSTPGFWETIPLCPNAYQLWDFCLPYRPVILTAIPSRKDWQERITHEKNRWIDNYLGFKVQRIICYRSEKQKYAGSISDILVDDTIQNISEWTEAGGFGIYHTDVDNSISKLRHILKEIH